MKFKVFALSLIAAICFTASAQSSVQPFLQPNVSYAPQAFTASGQTGAAQILAGKAFGTIEAYSSLPVTLASASIASGTASYVVNITNCALTSNVATLTAANLYAGSETGVVIAGLTGVCAPLNGTITVASATTSLFTASVVHANITSTANIGTATLTGATISAVATAASVVTATETNQFTTGEVVTIAGMPTAQGVYNGSYVVATASSPSFTAPIFTVTFAANGSNDGGLHWYPLNLATLILPGTKALTESPVTNTIYAVNLSGLTNLEFVTSGPFAGGNGTVVLKLSAGSFPGVL